MSLFANFDTDRGPIRIELFADKAPLTVASFVNLAQRGFYDGLTFHRVIADFMVQGGCPQGHGTGGPGYKFEDETSNGVRHERGVLSMANAGPNTNGSQFFLVYEDSRLRPDYTVFGYITEEGMRVLDTIAAGGVAPGDGGYPEDGAPAMTTTIERAKRTGAGAAGA